VVVVYLLSDLGLYLETMRKQVFDVKVFQCMGMDLILGIALLPLECCIPRLELIHQTSHPFQAKQKLAFSCTSKNK
jgi:hypothetical protein